MSSQLAAAKDHSIMMRMWLNISHVPDIPSDVREQGITIHDIATNIQQMQPASHLWTLVHDLQRRPVKPEWEGLFSPIHFLKQPWAAKQQQRHGSLALVQRPEEFGPLPLLLLQVLLIGSPLFPQIKAQEKIKWGTSAKRLNYRSPGFSSVCVRRHIIWKCFSFFFWLVSRA